MTMKLNDWTMVLLLAGGMAVGLWLWGCAGMGPGADGEHYEQQTTGRQNARPTSTAEARHRIEWDAGTLTLIQAGGCYGRMIRLRDGDLLCAFELGGRVAVRRSADGGRTWGEPVTAAVYPHGVAANPDLLQLRDGTIFCFYNERPAEGAAGHPFAIAAAASHDGGRTWGESRRLYAASADFHDGCWEPAGLELPSGEVHLYFANESPYRRSDEQEITLLRSGDSGRTWGAPETVSFRAGFRDGMPSPLVLAGGAGIALAIEDNGFNGNLQPAIVFTPLDDAWRSGPVGGDSGRRWSALTPPLARGAYAGAPCLRQMPGGATVMSFQQDDGGELQRAQMVVCMGDAGARNFGGATRPFPNESGAGQLWNSLCVKDRDTIIALATATIGGTWGLWSVEGRLDVE